MIIRSIDIEGVRNLSIRGLSLSSGFTLVRGENASGKTSILEAVNILFTGKSFRTPQFQKVIQAGSEEAWVSASFDQDDDINLSSTNSARLSVKRYRSGKFEIKNENSKVNRFSKVAALLPLQTLGPDLPNLVDVGTSGRRKYLDWAVFHVKPSFHADWVLYDRALKQRNALLKVKAVNDSEFDHWEQVMATHGATITTQRLEVFQQLKPYIDEMLDNHMSPQEGGLAIKTRLSKGWADHDDLRSVLEKHRFQDKLAGTTRLGPHRLEVKFLLQDGTPAKERLSRGQRKVLSYLLVLAQTQFFKQQVSKNILILIDDFSSELDSHYQRKVLKMLAQLDVQVLITEINADNSFGVMNLIESLGLPLKVFHVEHGKICAKTQASVAEAE